MQGREEDVIVLSCVRTDLGGLGFLSDWRRVNVAISRAKEQLIVVGDPQALANNRMWREVLRRLTLLLAEPLCCELNLYATN